MPELFGKHRCPYCGWHFGDNFEEHTASRAACAAFYSSKPLPLMRVRKNGSQIPYTPDEMRAMFPDVNPRAKMALGQGNRTPQAALL